MEEENRYSLSKPTVVIMVTVALFYDFVQAIISLLHIIPALGNLMAAIATALLSAVAWLTFYFWFKLHGIHFNTAKRALTMGSGFIIELIPVLNILPGWTLAVILVILTTKVPAINKIENAGRVASGSKPNIAPKAN